MALARAEQISFLSTRRGPVRFVPTARLAETCAELRTDRYVVASAMLTTPPEGRLREAIDDAVESALAMRGALPPGVGVGATEEATVRDQVLRARALGVAGLAVTFPPLPGMGPGQGLLHYDDAGLVSTWIMAAQRESVVLVFHERDRDARVLVPTRLADIVAPPPRDSHAPVPVEMATVEAAAPPAQLMLIAQPTVAMAPADVVTAVVVAPIVAADSVRAADTAVAGESSCNVSEPEPTTQRGPRPPPPVLAMPRRASLRLRPRVAVKAPVAEVAEAVAASQNAPMADVSEPLVEAPVSRAEPSQGAPPASRAEPSQASPPASQAAAQRVVDAASFRAHAVELDKARGPKPVSVIEKLFATRYAPLLGAIARGDADAAVKGVVDDWRAAFEHSYREAFASIRVTGKRPSMVFDAPDLAAKIARLNGARNVKLLLVDAMRFDVGERLAQRLGETLAGRAVCVERMLLWSAIPTTTVKQMSLLARGAEGLRDAEPSSEPNAEIVRGRAVGTIRRERAGSREVMKLDLVEARLRTAGAGYDERIDGIADEVAQITTRFVESLAPRTLLFVFGDHGFRLPVTVDARATGPATQGGVSPEEVLVPAYAWLVGGVH